MMNCTLKANVNPSLSCLSRYFYHWGTLGFRVAVLASCFTWLSQQSGEVHREPQTDFLPENPLLNDSSGIPIEETKSKMEVRALVLFYVCLLYFRHAFVLTFPSSDPVKDFCSFTNCFSRTLENKLLGSFYTEWETLCLFLHPGLC